MPTETKEPYQPEGLGKFLAEKGIPVHTWKIGATGELKKEIYSGKCTFVFNPPMRFIFLIGVIVLHEEFLLVEKQRELGNGETEVRKLKASISRELDSGEKPETGAERTLREALKVQSPLPPMTLKGMHEVERKSKVSYPGLPTRYAMYVFEIKLPKEFFNPDGYVDQNGRTWIGEKKYLVWKKVSGAH